MKSTEEDKKLATRDFSEEITEDNSIEDKAGLQVVASKCLEEVGIVINLLDMEEGSVIHNMAEQGTVVEKITIFFKNETNVMSFHVLDRLSQVDWDSSRLTNGDEQSM